MNNLESKNIVILAVVFALIIVGMFTYAFLKRGEIANEGRIPAFDEKPVEDERPKRIDAKHFYRDGVHTVAGEIAMPTPCDLLETDVIVAESFPEQVTINFTVINNAEACAQVITAQRFKSSFEVSERASIEATWNGKPAILNLIEAGDDEDPEDFELFIKG